MPNNPLFLSIRPVIAVAVVVVLHVLHLLGYLFLYFYDKHFCIYREKEVRGRGRSSVGKDHKDQTWDDCFGPC